MAFAIVNGARLAWQQLGDGPDLILVHGLGANRAFWFAQASALAADFRVSLFDLRGHGYSERTTSGYSASALGADILGLMDALGIDRAALAAHSHGGAAALEAALAAPRRCTQLALFDARIPALQPHMRLLDAELTPYERHLAAISTARYGYDWAREDQVGLRFLEAAARLRSDGVDDGVRDAFTPFGEGRGAQRAARQWLQLLDGTALRNEVDRIGTRADAIGRLAAPVLLMYARNSRCLPSGLALRERLPQARWVGIDAGHFFPLSHAAVVAAELRAFLQPTAHRAEALCP
ncbi:MAG: alpha/beta fold hydrolase [Gammaproteobacteria bacterium]